MQHDCHQSRLQNQHQHQHQHQQECQRHHHQLQQQQRQRPHSSSPTPATRHALHQAEPIYWPPSPATQPPSREDVLSPGLEQPRPQPDPRFYHPRQRYSDPKYPRRPQTAVVRDVGLIDYHRFWHQAGGSSGGLSHAQALPHLSSRNRTPEAPDLQPWMPASEHGYAADGHHHVLKYGITSTASTRPPSAHHVFSTYSISIDGDEGDVATDEPTARQTVRSLLHLACTALPLSTAVAAYTLAALLFSLLAAPFRLFLVPRLCFAAQLSSLLVPPLGLQLRCVFSSISSVATLTSQSSASSQTPLSSDDALQMNGLDMMSAMRLTMTHLVAPLVSLPLALCAWVMGTAWALGAIVSDERAGDDRDERRFAESLVNWWVRWLKRGLRLEDSSARFAHRGRKSEMGDRGDRIFV